MASCGDVDLARDIVQETFIQIWERRRTWKPRGSARAYLYRIVRNLVIDEKRRQGVRRRWAARREFAPSPRPATPDEVLDEQLLTEVFETAVAALPDRRREVFELVFQRGLSHADAGRRDGPVRADGGESDEFGSPRCARGGDRFGGAGGLRW